MIRVWLAGLVRRRAARFYGTVAAVALAVLVVASLGTFFSSAKAQMTTRATRGVPVDWQVQLAEGTNLAQAGDIFANTEHPTAMAEVGYAETTGFSSTAGGSVQTTGAGKALGLPAGYASDFPGELRMLVGTPDGAMLAQQTAANLHASIGTPVQVGRPGLPSQTVAVTGIVDLPNADSMFQTAGAPPGSGPTAPPDNVVLLPLPMWHQVFDQVARAHPSAVSTQIHLKLAGVLPSDPGAAFSVVAARAKHLEAALAGAGVVGNNIGAQLDAARTDAVYAQLLFLFLGLPGVVVAALITGVIAASGRARRRYEQALLRIRGASPVVIVRLALAEALAAGTLGAAAGLGLAALVGRLAFGTARFGATGAQTLGWTIASAAAGLVLATATVLVPAWQDARSLALARSRTRAELASKPVWARLYLDVVLLAAAGVIYWQAVRSGYRVVLAPEGVPTISVDTFTLAAPLLLWIGSALFAWRLSAATLARGRAAIAALTRPVAAALSGVVAASMARQRRLLSRALVIMAMAASFAVSTAVFNSTYTAQARVDAQLTNGADVSVATTPGSSLPFDLAARIRGVAGVVAAEPMAHRFAYVGNDLQDIYGIDPTTIGRATTMSNAFFAGGDASRTLALLASHPDGVLVSDETVRDFQLQPGDLVRLRLQSGADHAYHVIAFHYIGIVREFPTAPRDSFIVANASYLESATRNPSAQVVLVQTNGSPPAVAARVHALLGAAPGPTVSDAVTELHTTLSSLTAIDLSGLTRLQLGFAFALAIAASGLVLWLGLAERRRTFAIAAALGARPRQLASFVWSEAAFVTAGGLVLGVLSGWALALVIVKILTGVFDPPPEHLFVPWTYLAAVGATALGAIAAASSGALRASRAPAVELIRDL